MFKLQDETVKSHHANTFQNRNDDFKARDTDVS